MSFDYILKNGKVVDGCGNPWFYADIGINDGKIVKIGTFNELSSENIINVKNLVISPGFIDIHDHSGTGIIKDPKAEQKVKQGVTTVMVGNCGTSVAPLKENTKAMLKATNNIDPTWTSFSEYFRILEEKGIAINLASHIGHGTIRGGVMGYGPKKATEQDLIEMKKMVRQAMEEGAFGLSTGLIYTPGHHSTTEEIIELAKTVAEYGGFYATHIRGHGPRDIEGVKEAVKIAKATQIRTQISHIETHLPDAWGHEAEMLEVVENAREKGLDVKCDILTHVCHTGENVLELYFQHFQDHPEGLQGFIKQLGDETYREEIKRLDKEESYRLCSLVVKAPEKIRIFSLGDKTLKELADQTGKEPFDFLFDLILEGKKNGINHHGMITIHDENDLRLAIKHPLSMIVGDGSIGGTEPRDYGIFPLTYRKYVRGETRKEMPEEIGTKLLTMEEFIRKCTSYPAQRIELGDRGVIREGCWADLTIFDPINITDVATYKNPHHYPRGIEYVFINGVLVIDKGEHTGKLPGRVLRGPGYNPLKSRKSK